MRVERHVVFWLVALALVVIAVGLLREVLLPFVMGAVLAYFLNPLVDRLQTSGLGRGLATALVVAVIMLAVITFIVIVVPILASQAQQVAVSVPTEAERLRGVIDEWAKAQFGPHYPAFQSALEKAMRGIAENWSVLAGWLAAEALTTGKALFQFVSLLLVTPLVMFYMLIDWPRMIGKIDGWLPRDNAPTIRRIAGEIDAAVSAFIRGQGTVCLILAFYYATALTAVGLDYGLLVGLATGLMSFVPFVGWALGLIVSLGLGILQSWPDTSLLVWIAAVYLFAQALDAGFLSPQIVGSKIGLHPVWLILALFVFSYLFGFIGALLAVPVAAALGVLARFGLKAYLASGVYQGQVRPSDIERPAASARTESGL
ncbi:MAG: AI-2E family transporter [Hyphomicrobium sp.]|nr:AI-2E family transporter [Hyphomicrobium sp.]